jgi:RNA polymerase sigma-70 factor (ECF subfamily)
MQAEETIDAMLARLSAGDAQAAVEVFRRYEPFLRMVVRRQLSPAARSKFDSADIVQSVWADLLPGLRSGRWAFETPEQFRSFLVRAARNRLVDRLRQQAAPLRAEERLAEGRLQEVPEPSPPIGSELEAHEMWGSLLALCPPQHAPILRLKRAGLSNAEIAGQVGLHEGSVRRILAELAARLSLRTAGGGGAAP